MLEALTSEALLSLATIAVSALAACGMLVALRATRPAPRHADLDAIVKAAPYKRLHNVIQPNTGWSSDS